MTVNIPPQVDIAIITLFGISAFVILYIFLNFLGKKSAGVIPLSIYFGLFPLSFAIGEIFEYAEKLTGIEAFGSVEKGVTIIGTSFLLMALLKHARNLVVKEGELPQMEIEHARTKKKRR